MSDRDRQGQQITNVCVCGNTKLLEPGTVKQISKYYNLLVAGDNDLNAMNGKKIHVFEDTPVSERFSKLCYSFSPDVVWYISGYCDGGDGFENEPKMIENLMRDCANSDVSHVIMVSSMDSLNHSSFGSVSQAEAKDYSSERALCCAYSEILMRYLANMHEIKLTILRVSYLAKELNDTNFLGRLFSVAKENQATHIDYAKETQFEIISMRNLVDLLVSVSEEAIVGSGEYSVVSGFKHTYGELIEKISEKNPAFGATFGDEKWYPTESYMEIAMKQIRRTYGFVATEDCLENIDQYYEDFASIKAKKISLRERVKNFFNRQTNIFIRYFELILFFFVTQFLLQYTSTNVYFRYVDLRLFFIVVLAITYGMKIGILAGLLECLSLFFTYGSIGVTGTMLFYNMDYWLPFVIYLLAGSMIGYIKNVNDQRIKFTEDENQVLREKYIFLNSVYQQVIDNKSEYKRQILGYKDSFGKIFEAVEQLNASVISNIFMNGVETLERILDNHSIAIYTLDDYQKYARLVACSREMNQRLAKSLKVDDFKCAYDVISKNENWKNTEFIENIPMYAYGINRDGKVQIMITVYEADSNQMGLYYMNLFGILCNLIRVSFARAFEYQTAIEGEKYYEDTMILKPKYFNEILEVQRKMNEVQMASYALFKLESSDRAFINDAISGMIRQNDVIGAMDDGNYYLMLTQVTKESVDIVRKRLAERDISFQVVGE